MNIQKDYPLKPLATFKIGGNASFFANCENLEDLKQAIEFAKTNHLSLMILGGSSNMLISDSGFKGLVISLNTRGKKIIHDSEEYVLVRLEAGENWDEAVLWSCQNNWWGIENLSHIPGRVGASVVQNIGAYGQQISDTLSEVEVLNSRTGKIEKITANECGFGYRKSIFNTSSKGEYAILAIVLKLQKSRQPNFSYSDLKTCFSENQNPSLLEIRNAIIKIRDAKFPYPTNEFNGNAGSFFKNLNLSLQEYENFKKVFLQNFSLEWQEKLDYIKNKFLPLNNTGQIKIPAAFLIQACGFPGKVIGKVKVNEKQPLVLLNNGGATARDVLAVAKQIRKEVFTKTGLVLSVEPELVGFSEQELKEFLEL